jgi:hypothetical protein
MHKVEPVKRILEKASGVGIPSKAEALSRVSEVKPRRLKFHADGYIPNNPSLPLLYYAKAVRFERHGDPAALLEAIFNANGWGDAWRNGIYDFVHYHPRIHESLGIARGTATLRLGGSAARRQQRHDGQSQRRRCDCGAGGGRPRMPVGRPEFSGRRRLSAFRHLQRMPRQLPGIRQGL